MLERSSTVMAPDARGYSTKELTRNNWPDFEKLFETHPAPGAYPCWCMYYHRLRPLPESEKLQTRVKRVARNHREKRELVRNGRSHGILVYAEGKPVGWCQYGPSEELPRIDNNPKYRGLAPEGDMERLWRITCFVVDRKYQKRGVASAALKAALESIRNKGGGLVEAYPIIRWGAYADWSGTASMFKKEGFKIVAPFGKSNVVMRRTI
jgi:GNAT superfamily N-acetyltransferase